MTLCDSTQHVHFLSATESGRVQDKKVADAYALSLPAGCVLRQDLGLLGHAPAVVTVEMPHKKPPKRELTFSQKIYNQLLSPLRVVIEHAHSGIKRLHRVQGTLRLRGEWVRDTVRDLWPAQPARPQPASGPSRTRTRETRQLLRISFITSKCCRPGVICRAQPSCGQRGRGPGDGRMLRRPHQQPGGQ